MSNTPKEFTVTITTERKFREGWGVAFCPVHQGEGDDGIPEGSISSVESTVVHITEQSVVISGNVPCVRVPEFNDHMHWPVENFRATVDDAGDDTHDLRDRWFATEKEARDHQDYTMRRWDNPQPWESFVKTS